jgi:hypothetical protein
MAKADRLKEEIGWLKLQFGVLVAIDASLVGWLAQRYSAANKLVLYGSLAAICAVSTGILWTIRIAYRRIAELEEA